MAKVPENWRNDMLPIKAVGIELAADFDNTEQSSGYTLPTNAIVLDVFLVVDTADAGETLDVGTDSTASGDADGYLDGVSVASTGLVRPTLVSTGQTRGALLRQDEDGAGALVPGWDATMGGKEITYTGSHATANTVRGRIVIVYIDCKEIV